MEAIEDANDVRDKPCSAQLTCLEVLALAAAASTSSGSALRTAAAKSRRSKRSAKDKLIRPTIKEGFAYHEYTLLDTTKKRADGAFADATEVYIFHIIPVKDAIIHAPRLGLPPSVCLSTAESRALSAVLRVQGFLDDPLPNPESNKILPQLPPTPTLDTEIGRASCRERV